ncbi:MAG TPA: zf-HC2 domain-containing protein [Acidimicrobiales bacterium]
MTMDCTALAYVAPELALGILPGDERAAAIAHLDGCRSCRELVASLTGVVDAALECGPTEPPPPGFEQRVLSRLGVTPARRARRRARPRIARVAMSAAAVLIVVVATIVVGLRDGDRDAALAAPMRTGHDDVVGEAVVHDGDEPVLHVSVPEWSAQVAQYGTGSDSYSIIVDHIDGPDEIFPIESTGATEWNVVVARRDIDSVAIVDGQGRVWCRAEF